MSKKLALMVVFALFLHYTTTFADVQAPIIDSSSIYIASSATPQVIYQNNAEERFPPGALTHGMTAIIALENADADTLITITDDLPTLENLTSSRVFLKPGETYTIRTLIQAMLVGNGDDAALALALHVSGGDIPSFVEMMNQRAGELGATNTNFAVPTGLAHADQYTTAADLALIYRHAWTMHTIQSALEMKGIVLPATEFAQERGFRTNNYLIDDFTYSKYFYPYATAGKTGYHGRSVCNIVAFARHAGMDVMVVVMGGTASNDEIQSLYDARTGFKYAFNEYESQTAITHGDIIYEARLAGAGGRHNNLHLVADDNLRVFVRKGDTTELQREVTTTHKTFRAPIRVGDVLGEVSISYNGEFIASIPLVSSENISASAWGGLSSLFLTIFSSMIFRLLFGLFIIWILYKSLYLEPKRRRQTQKLKRRKIAEERRKEYGM